MIRRPPRSTLSSSSAASDVYKRQGGPESVAACRSQGIKCDTSTPHAHKRNAIAEEKIKRVLYASRTLLEHAGLDVWYWPHSAKAACAGLNVIGGTRSPYHRRHGTEFAGKLIPFGCLIDYLLTSNLAGDVPEFAPRVIPGIFLGHHFYSGAYGETFTPTRRAITS